MKKIVLFLLIAVVAASAVWAQIGPPPFDQTILGARKKVIEQVGLWDFFVDQTVSTEKRYSAEIFSSYADDFIWFTGYDQKVGNFLLLGGYPSDTTDVASTDYLTDVPYTLNFGFGKSLKSGYLGVYYGGNFVNAEGTNNGLKGEDSFIYSKSTWTNRLAILYGNEKIGAIRFDFLYDNTTYEEYDVDGKPRAKTVANAPQIAFGWGKTLAKETEFYVQLGLKFADYTEITTVDGKKKDTIWGSYTFHPAVVGPPIDIPAHYTFDNVNNNAKLALQLGIYKPLASKDKNTESSFSIDFLIGNIFGAQAEGDNLLDGKFIGGGIFLLGADVGIKSVTTVDKLSFGFKPNVELGFTIDDTGSAISGSKQTYDATKTVKFELAAGVNFGIKYQLNQKFALYTGVGIDLFSWRAGGYSEGKDEKYDKDASKNLYVKNSAWAVDGLSWRDGTLHDGSGMGNNNLGFGLTYAPGKNIVIGAGLNTLLDKLIMIDLKKMSLQTGFSNSGDGSESSWVANNTLANLTFDLTISLKF